MVSLVLLERDDQPEQHIEQEPWNSARDQGYQECQPNPECANTEKFGESAAYTQEHAIAPRSA